MKGVLRGAGVALVLSVVLSWLVVRPLIAEVLRIPSESMAPTLEPGDRVLIAKRMVIGEFRRDDLVAFKDTNSDSGISIKRLVGRAGDTIEIRDGALLVNGKLEHEPYVDHDLLDSYFFGPERVPPGRVFLLGDNRSNSVDSRTIGPVDEQDLLGRVILEF